MISDIYWIETGDDPRLAIMARPRAGDWLEDEVANWKRSGIGIVVSLLETHEVEELGLQDESEMCSRMGIEYKSFPIQDREVPRDAAAAFSFATEIQVKNEPIAIHCRAGIGRSTLMAACVLLSRGLSADRALERIQKARGLPVPDTAVQRDWLMRLQDKP